MRTLLTCFSGIIIAIIIVLQSENVIDLTPYLPMISIIGIIALPLLLYFLLIRTALGLLANNCNEHPLSEELDLLARQEAEKLKKRFDISRNEQIELYIDELDIYDNINPKEVEWLKAHITNYYYNLK